MLLATAFLSALPDAPPLAGTMPLLTAPSVRVVVVPGLSQADFAVVPGGWALTWGGPGHCAGCLGCVLMRDHPEAKISYCACASLSHLDVLRLEETVCPLYFATRV